MRARRLLLPVLLSAFAAPRAAGQAGSAPPFPPAEPDLAGWQTAGLVDEGPLAIRLRHRAAACAADPYWIGFEFENRGSDTARPALALLSERSRLP